MHGVSVCLHGSPNMTSITVPTGRMQANVDHEPWTRVKWPNKTWLLNILTTNLIYENFTAVEFGYVRAYRITHDMHCSNITYIYFLYVQYSTYMHGEQNLWNEKGYQFGTKRGQHSLLRRLFWKFCDIQNPNDRLNYRQSVVNQWDVIKSAM